MERAFYSSSEDRSVSTYRAEQEVKSWKAPPLGRLTVEVSQPSHGGSLECCTNNEISTSIMLQLRFDPRGKSQPPQLRTLQPTLKAVTTLTTRPETTHLAADNIVTDAQYQGTSVQEISLPPVDISSAQWVKHSACESSSTPQPITSHTGTSYTASIAVPIILQKSSKLLPTFHSCLVSRIYRLELRACYQMSDTAILHRFVKLDMPIQLNNLQDSNRLNHSPSVSPAPCDNTKQWRIQACTQRQTDTLPSYLDSITK
ncbi:hypothetical protein BDV25DRAFT_150266 [Aspergillus avenaceus]|uniref:Arrestin-like N-terminal domain-containing protein n=1 Tax=Aspergillus avenaceus TaxID=36643 RepID=A0A5N6U2Z5_ASPAV|nr:hypothetical protein BDV25DRAFT_150266 [Aspergillus avenaceus]